MRAVLIAAVWGVAVAKNRPVAKVLGILEGMITTLNKEAEEDQATFDKFSCWCTTNRKEKDSAAEEAERTIGELTTEIETQSALSGQLAAEIANHKKNRDSASSDLEAKTTKRTADQKDFQAAEGDSITAIEQLKGALGALAKGSAMFLQSQPNLRHTLRKLRASMEVAPAAQRLDSLLQSMGPQEYANQSGEITGILTDMQETMEKELSQSQQDELKTQATYQKYKGLKEAEIKSENNSFDEKTKRKGDADSATEQAKADLADTKDRLSADTEFLLNLKEKCATSESDFEERTNTRNEETKAVQEALGVLSDDDAKDLTSRTLTLMQISSETSSRRAAAKDVLNTAAKQLKKPKLAALALRITDANEGLQKVLKAIGKMQAGLDKQKADEVKQKDYCVDEINNEEGKILPKDMQDEEISATELAETTALTKRLRNEIAALEKTNAENDVEAKAAGETRDAQNKEYQAAWSDQQSSIELLQAAETKLNAFYDAKADLIQEPAGPPPPKTNTYQASSAAAGVLTLIGQIVSDTQRAQTKGQKEEQDAQTDYESLSAQFQKTRAANVESIEQYQGDIAKAEAKLVVEKKDLKIDHTEVGDDKTTIKGLHGECDWGIENFDARQAAITEETDAIVRAASILKGAK